MRSMSLPRKWLGDYPPMIWIIAAGSFLNIAGLSFIWPLTTVYIHDYLGQPMTTAGLVLLFHSGGAALGQLTGGWLYDRIGAKPIMLTGLLTSALLIGLLGFFESWPLYIGVMIGFGFTASLVSPAINALVAKAWPGGERRAFNFVYVANNIGVAAGTALGGLLAERSFALAFLSAGATFLLFALFVVFVIRDDWDEAAAVAASEPEREMAATREEQEQPVPWVALGALFAAFLTLWLIYVQWQSQVSVYMRANGHSLSSYAVLWTLNGLLIFAGQPLLSRTLRYLKRSASQMVLGTLLYAASLLVLLIATDYWVYVVSMVILTFGEMLLWPAVPAAVARLSPPSRRGTLQGLILSGATFGRMLGPLFGGLLHDHTDFPTLILVMTAGLAVPLVAIFVYGRTQSTE